MATPRMHPRNEASWYRGRRAAFAAAAMVVLIALGALRLQVLRRDNSSDSGPLTLAVRWLRQSEWPRLVAAARSLESYHHAPRGTPETRAIEEDLDHLRRNALAATP